MEFYVFNDYGDLILITEDESYAQTIAEQCDGYYCSDEN